MLILYKNDRNVRYVLFMKTSTDEIKLPLNSPYEQLGAFGSVRLLITAKDYWHATTTNFFFQTTILKVSTNTFDVSLYAYLD